MSRLILLFVLHAMLAACASTPSPGAVGDSPAARVSSPPPADRAAILAMAGGYRVHFAFDETVLLEPDYERAEPHRSGADELVVVVEDAGRRIVLQHLLLGPGGHVTKHWRQDWTFEATERMEFVDDQTWALRPVPVERVAGSWTQCVFEVNDAPRYCGTGRWNHRYGHATWTSDRTWRPLPRREHTKRKDYNALNGENRHTITPAGWTHEQDNSKVRRTPDGAIEVVAREFGFNEYVRSMEVDFTPARDHWTATQAYWARVRAVWAELFARGGVRLEMPVDGMPLIRALFGQAARAARGEVVATAEIREAIERHVSAPGTPSPTAAVAR